MGSERLIWMEDSNTNQEIHLYTLHTSKISDTVILHNDVLILGALRITGATNPLQGLRDGQLSEGTIRP